MALAASGKQTFCHIFFEHEAPGDCHTLSGFTAPHSLLLWPLLPQTEPVGTQQMGLVQSRLGPRVGKICAQDWKLVGRARGWTWCQRCDQLSVQPGVPGYPCRSNSHFGFKVTWASLVFLAQKHTLKNLLSPPWSNDSLRCHVRDISGGFALEINETRIRLSLFWQERLWRRVFLKGRWRFCTVSYCVSPLD